MQYTCCSLVLDTTRILHRCLLHKTVANWMAARKVVGSWPCICQDVHSTFVAVATWRVWWRLVIQVLFFFMVPLSTVVRGLDLQLDEFTCHSLLVNIWNYAWCSSERAHHMRAVTSCHLENAMELYNIFVFILLFCRLTNKYNNIDYKTLRFKGSAAML
jgi:hypothetical protein